MTWRYTQAPTRELNWYPRGTKTWPGAPLLNEFDDMSLRGGADESAVIEQVNHHGAVASDYLVPPKSGDSWRAFYNRNSIGFGYEWNNGRYESKASYQNRKHNTRHEHPASVEQRAWEQARIDRMRTQREASDTEWAAAERKVSEAEAALKARLSLEAEEQKARQAAAQAEALERRRRAIADAERLHAEAEAKFHAQERRDWLMALQDAIMLCVGTPYAALIPQMQADITKIESMPAGPLPWRFDRTAFYQHFRGFQAQIDAGTYVPPV
jgi:hypothetical protein